MIRRFYKWGLSEPSTLVKALAIMLCPITWVYILAFTMVVALNQLEKDVTEEDEHD